MKKHFNVQHNNRGIGMKAILQKLIVYSSIFFENRTLASPTKRPWESYQIVHFESTTRIPRALEFDLFS